MSYTRLRKFLIADGYQRIAPEVFMRILPNRKSLEKYYSRLKEYAPIGGCVQVLKVTEKQYASTWYLTGEEDYQEKAVGANCHIML